MVVCFRLLYCLAALSCYWKVSISQTVTISADAEEGIEGQSLTISCVAPSSSSGTNLAFEINSVQNNSIPRDVNGRNAVFTLGPLTRMDNGSTIRCRDLLEGISSDIYALVINYTGRVNELVTQGEVDEGDMFVATYTIDANPPVSKVTVRDSGSNAIVSGSGGRFSANSTTAVISTVLCQHGGTYTLQAINDVGIGLATTFTVSVTPVGASFGSNFFRDSVDDGRDDDYNISGCSGSAADEVSLVCTFTGGSILRRTVFTDVFTPVVWKRSDFVTCGLSNGRVSLSCNVSNAVGSDNATVIVSYGFAACHDVTCCLAPVLVFFFIAILILAAVVIIVVVVWKKKKK